MVASPCRDIVVGTVTSSVYRQGSPSGLRTFWQTGGGQRPGGWSLIHEPAVERELQRLGEIRLRQRADEAAFTFPVVIDRTKANWNAWGNSMWPSVYLIDKRGYLRFFWPGELKWKGATGDQWMGARIDELLAEPVEPPDHSIHEP